MRKEKLVQENLYSLNFYLKNDLISCFVTCSSIPKNTFALVASSMSYMKWFSIVLIVLVQHTYGQESISEFQAKQAVYHIVQYSGLLPNFTVRENEEVTTAIAYIKDKKRYIEYNPAVMESLMDSTKTDWAMISILAHEIAHHLLGHTLAPKLLSPGDELACDRYSGFILQRMGATLDESVAAIQVAGSAQGTKTHPPREARVHAISQGWNESLNQLESKIQGIAPADKIYVLSLRFDGDENLYYVDDASNVLWYNEFAQPILLGKMVEVTLGDYRYEIVWEGQKFYVDRHNKIWNMTTYNVMLKVGKVEILGTEK